ncbi:MAG: hypothetical protein GEV09_28030, partial [Pseudonocardiaceae bacterium]|nr:hypothetical protein [Pseudonocardiaceae bacterium]
MARTRISTPASAVLVAWGNAWLAGHCGTDEVVDALEREHGPQVAGGAEEHPALPPLAELPLGRLLAELRGHGLSAFRLALPVPGDPLGLPGPAAFNSTAIEAGEAALVELADTPLGLVPVTDVRGSSYAGLRWTGHALAEAAAATPTLPEAEQHLALTLREAADTLLEL